MSNYKMGASVRVKPGLRNRPSISGKDAVVLETINDRVKIQIGTLITMIESSEVQPR
jgi:hypothetical protein